MNEPAVCLSALDGVTLRAILDELRALRREVAAMKTPRPVAPRVAAIRAHPGPLLTAIANYWGVDRLFSAGELTAFANEFDIEPRRALRAALVGRSPRALGRYLRSIADAPAGGYIIERLGADRVGAMWILRECGNGGNKNSHDSRIDPALTPQTRASSVVPRL